MYQQNVYLNVPVRMFNYFNGIFYHWVIPRMAQVAEVGAEVKKDTTSGKIMNNDGQAVSSGTERA